MVSIENEDISKMTRGLESLIELSSQCNDIDLHSYLLTKPSAVMVHNSRRRSYQYKAKRRHTDKEQLIDESTVSKILRSSSSFNWKQHCFF